MGWHERHASLRWGSRGISRPEALNLEAWNFMLRNFEKRVKKYLKLLRGKVWKSVVLCGIFRVR